MADQVRPEDVHESVRSYYADKALQAQEDQACCSTAGCECDVNYPAEMLQELPEELREFSLGCADPISAAALREGETVLDLGCGGGLDCVLAARRVGETGRIIGLDMTEEMLARARGNAERLGLANVEFHKGLIESLPLEDGTVDAVISNCVINLSPDKPRVFAEIHRVLRPGGRLAVADIVTSSPMRPSLRTILNSWAACIAGALTVDEYVRGLRQAGFEDVLLRSAEGGAVEGKRLGIPFSALITARKAESLPAAGRPDKAAAPGSQ